MIKRGTIPCSVMMYIKNGGPRLRQALESTVMLREHLILDGGSTDGSLELAREYDCRIVRQDSAFLSETGRIIDFGGIATQAYNETREPWIVFLAADEQLSPQCVEEMVKVIDADRRGAYFFDRYFMIDGRVRRYSSTKENRQIRFCHRSAVLGFRKRVHERPILAQGVVPEVLPRATQYMPLTETPAELWVKYLRYITLEEGHFVNFGWLRWLHFAVRRLAIMVVQLSRMLWMRLRYDRRDCLPLRYDLLNVKYGWELVRRSCPLYRRRVIQGTDLCSSC